MVAQGCLIDPWLHTKWIFKQTQNFLWILEKWNGLWEVIFHFSFLLMYDYEKSFHRKYTVKSLAILANKYTRVRKQQTQKDRQTCMKIFLLIEYFKSKPFNHHRDHIIDMFSVSASVTYQLLQITRLRWKLLFICSLSNITLITCIKSLNT